MLFRSDVVSDALADWNLQPTTPNWAQAFGDYWQPGEEGACKKLSDFVAVHLKGYSTSRDEPAKDSTSKLSPHLHFGEISPWKIWRAMEQVKSQKDCDLTSVDRFLSELGWREFSWLL